ncbi:MAG: PKD domain-containing protein [bacterium]
MGIKKLSFIISTISIILNLLNIAEVKAVSGSIVINNNAPYTNSRDVTLTLSTTPKADWMCFANEDSDWSEWEPFETSKSWTLSSGEGNKIVYAWFWWDEPIDSMTDDDTITLDTTPPEVSINYPKGWVKSIDLYIDLEYSDKTSGVAEGDVEVAINDLIDYKDCKNTIYDFWYSGSHGNKYAFRFKAKDYAGNWSGYAEPGYWCGIDTVAPEITDYNPKDGAILTGQVTVSFSAQDSTSGIEDYRIIINGVVDTYATSYSWNTTNYADGSYDISYITVDKAGNNAEKNITVKVDNTKPGCSVVLGDEEGGNNLYDNDGWVYATLDNWDYGAGVSNAWINWTTDEFGNGGTWIEISPSHKSEWYVYIGEGQRYCWYKVQDKAGNENKTYDYITIDKTPPTADAGGDKEIDEDTSTEFSASGSIDNIGISKYEWDWENDGKYDDWSWLSFIYHTYDDPGVYKVKLRVTDNVENTDTDIITVTVRDTTLPEAWIMKLGDDKDTDTKYDNDGTIYATLRNDDNVGVIKTWINWTADYWGNGGTWLEIPPGTTSVAHYYDTDGEKYCWYRAQDAAGNMGTCTLPQVIIVDRQPPIADAGYDKWVYEEETVRFDGSASYDDCEIVTYKWDFENDGYYDKEGEIVYWTFWDPRTYTTKLYVEDGAGNPGTDTIQVVVLDATPPSKPTGLQAAPDVLQITVSWNPNSELDLNYYCVHIKDDEYITPYNFDYCIFVDKNITDYTFSNLTELKPYYFIVTAIDNYWNESEASSVVSAAPLSPGDITPPAPPTNLQINDPGNGSELDLSWTAPPDNDVSYYNIYEGDRGTPTKESYYYKYDGLAYNITNTSFTAYQLTSGQRYYYGITAVDTSGNESELSQINSEIPKDLTKPEPPWGLSAIGGENIVYLGWIGSIDTVAGYNVYRKPAGGNYTKIASLVKDTYYDDTDVIADTTYYYYVKAESEFGIETDASNESYATPYTEEPPPDTTPPARPTVTDITEKETEIDLIWSRSTEADFDRYNLYKSQTPNGPYTNIFWNTDRNHNYYNDTGLESGTTYYYIITAKDANGNENPVEPIYKIQANTKMPFIKILKVEPNNISPYNVVPTTYSDIIYYLQDSCGGVIIEIYNSQTQKLVFKEIISKPEPTTPDFNPFFRWDGHRQDSDEYATEGCYDLKMTVIPGEPVKQPETLEDRLNLAINVSHTTPPQDRLIKLIIRPIDIDNQVQTPWHYGQADENSYLLADEEHEAEVRAEIIIDTDNDGIVDAGEPIDTDDNNHLVTFRVVQGQTYGDFRGRRTTSGLTQNGIATGHLHIRTTRQLGDIIIRAEYPGIEPATSTVVDTNPTDGYSNPGVRRSGSRVLQENINGYDVERMQNLLRFICYDFIGNQIDGMYGPHTREEVIRFKRANQGTWLSENQLNPPGSQVNADTITNLLNHRNNFQNALDVFAENTITQNDARFPQWREDASADITNLPEGIITDIPPDSTDEEELLRGMIEQESSGTHWQNRRITISFRGALGFLQIQPFNSLAYNNLGNIPANTNLYAPDGNLLAGAQYMNVPCLNTAFNYCQVSGDDNIDLLAKALAGYNGGELGVGQILRSYAWMYIVRDDLMSEESIRYAIQIKQRLNILLKSWTYPNAPYNYSEAQWLEDH